MKRYNKLVSLILVSILLLSSSLILIEAKAMDVNFVDSIKDIEVESTESEIEIEEDLEDTEINTDEEENIDEELEEDITETESEEVEEELDLEEIELEDEDKKEIENLINEEEIINIDYSEGVSNKEELLGAIDIAESGDILTLKDGYIYEDIIIIMPDKEIIIDGEGKVWDTGEIKIQSGGYGNLVFRNFEFTGMDKDKITNESTTGNLIIEDSEFYGTKGAIKLRSESNTEINRCRFYDNVSTNRGAGIDIPQGNTNLRIIDSTFEDNISNGAGWEAGVISSKLNTGKIEIENTIFRNNKNKVSGTGVLGGGGGAISLNQPKGIINIKNSIFDGNSTNGEDGNVKGTYDGGAIYVLNGNSGGELNIEDTTFTNNIAYDDGGAIMVQGTGNPGFTTGITNSTFYGNKAYGLSGGNRSGGAIQFFKNGGSSRMINNIDGCTFVNNQGGNESGTVEQQGGAIGLSGSSWYSIATVKVDKSLFVGNIVFDGGLVNESSRYKDITSNSRTDLGNTNVINIGEDISIEDILGNESPVLTDNYSGVRAGVDQEIVETVAILPEGIANNSNQASGGVDQRGYVRNKDNGAIQISWVKYNANGGEFKLDELANYDGKIFYKENIDGKIVEFYQVKYINASGEILDEVNDLKIFKEDKQFKGWSRTKEDNEDKVDYNARDSFVFEENDMILYAVWSEDIPVIEKYSIEYRGNGNTSGSAPIDSKEYIKDEEAKILGQNNLAKVGYSFKGWNTKADGTGSNYTIGNSFNVIEDIVLYAKWEKNEVNPGPDPDPNPNPDPNPGPGPNPSIPGITRPILPENEIAVLEEYHEAYIEGYEDETIRADDNITRAEVAAIFYRILSDEERESMHSTDYKYIDDSYEWSKDYIASLSNGGILKGYLDGSFRPNDNITRAEVVTMIRRYNKLEDGSSPYKDVINHWAVEHIGSVHSLNWIEGYEDGTFRPEHKITRAEFATIINRMLDRGISKENIPVDKIVKFKDLKENKWYYEEIIEASNSHNYIKLDENVRQSELWLDVIDK